MHICCPDSCSIPPGLRIGVELILLLNRNCFKNLEKRKQKAFHLTRSLCQGRVMALMCLSACVSVCLSKICGQIPLTTWYPFYILDHFGSFKPVSTLWIPWTTNYVWYALNPLNTLNHQVPIEYPGPPGTLQVHSTTRCPLVILEHQVPFVRFLTITLNYR